MPDEVKPLSPVLVDAFEKSALAATALEDFLGDLQAELSKISPSPDRVAKLRELIRTNLAELRRQVQIVAGVMS